MSIKIDVIGDNQADVSAIVNMLAVVLSCVQSPSDGKELAFEIDRKIQTVKDGLLDDDELSNRLEAMVQAGTKVVLTESVTAGAQSGLILPPGVIIT